MQKIQKQNVLTVKTKFRPIENVQNEMNNMKRPIDRDRLMPRRMFGSMNQSRLSCKGGSLREHVQSREKAHNKGNG